MHERRSHTAEEKVTMPSGSNIAENAVAESHAESGVESVNESETDSQKWNDYLEGFSRAFDLYPDESDGGSPQSDLLMLYIDGLTVQNDMAIAWKKLLADEHLD